MFQPALCTVLYKMIHKYLNEVQTLFSKVAFMVTIVADKEALKLLQRMMLCICSINPLFSSESWGENVSVIAFKIGKRNQLDSLYFFFVHSKL